MEQSTPAVHQSGVDHTCCAVHVLCCAVSTVQVLRDLILDYMEAHTSAKLYVCGHSLGETLALHQHCTALHGAQQLSFMCAVPTDGRQLGLCVDC